MSAGEVILVVAAVLCVFAFTALIVVLIRVLDAMREMRREVDQLRMETSPLIRELVVTTDDARATIEEARADLERFDEVLGSAEAIGDAVGGRVTRTTFSAPMIKAASFARGTSRTIARLRGGAKNPAVGPLAVDAIESGGSGDPDSATQRSISQRRRRRA